MAIKVDPPDMNDIIRKSGRSAEEVKAFLQVVQRSMEPHQKRIAVVEAGDTRYYAVERRGIGMLQTEHGPFWQFNFAIDDTWGKYSVLVRAELDRESFDPIFARTDRLVLRTDSGCETGQLFGDLTCECGEQLKLAMKTISEIGEGVIVHIPHQDGRGMGLTFKLATLWLQEHLKVHTVESAGLLAPGGVIDVRTYAGVICILKFFGIPETCVIDLATNNPHKVGVFSENGYTVSDELIPVHIPATAHTAENLRAKRLYLDHTPDPSTDDAGVEE